MELEVRKRLNKAIGEQVYWKWYVDIPSGIAKDLDLKVGDKVKITKVK